MLLNELVNTGVLEEAISFHSSSLLLQATHRDQIRAGFATAYHNANIQRSQLSSGARVHMN